MNSSLSICSITPRRIELSKQLADQYQLIWHPKPENGQPGYRFQLQLTETHIQLVDQQQAAFKPLYIDFCRGKNHHRRQFGGGKSQLIAKAFALNKGFKPNIIDATAGLGSDSFVLAAMGCRVTLLERSPALACLLQDALLRAQQDPQLNSIAAHMHLRHINSLDYLGQNDTPIDADMIYLDPMFPEKKGSALVKKEMQYLHHLVGKDSDADQLLSCALRHARYRVIVKRPAYAGFLNNSQPQLQLKSGKMRFDIYINRGIQVK